MVQKMIEQKIVPFDDTPRGLLMGMLIVGGVVVLASTSPVLFAVLAGIGYVVKGEETARRQKLQSAFSYLKRRGYVKMVSRGGKTSTRLTQRGERRAHAHRAKKLLLEPIIHPARWDGKWHLVLFDIPTGERAKRNAFRTFIKKIGAVMLQKSVWVYPFDCSERVALLRDFFDLSEKELRVIVTDSIGNDTLLRKHFDC